MCSHTAESLFEQNADWKNDMLDIVINIYIKIVQVDRGHIASPLGKCYALYVETHWRGQQQLQ